jgi:hypothetical protein
MKYHNIAKLATDYLKILSQETSSKWLSKMMAKEEILYLAIQ